MPNSGLSVTWWLMCPSAVQNEHWEHGRCVHETKMEVLASSCPCVQGFEDEEVAVLELWKC